MEVVNVPHVDVDHRRGVVEVAVVVVVVKGLHVVRAAIQVCARDETGAAIAEVHATDGDVRAAMYEHGSVVVIHRRRS